MNDYVDFFGVACFFEAQKIRELTTKSILIFGAIEKENLSLSFSYSVGNLDDIKYLISQNKPFKVHFKVNTGMNRYGFNDFGEFKKALKSIKKSKLILEGIYTHFATTDEFVNVQMGKFMKFVNFLRKMGFDPMVHADNSAVNEKFNHHLDMVRIGFNLFNNKNNGFLPVVQIKSQIVEIQNVKKNSMVGYNSRFVTSKNMKVAIVPVGYADGFLLKYIGIKLSVNSKLCEVLNVCMDCFFLDITNLEIKKGADVFILNNINSLNFYASYLETHEYEIMTQFSKIRAERILN